MEIEIQKYEQCLNEIKQRIEVIKTHLTGKNSTRYLITEVEFLAIQFRKVVELIAFSSIVVNKDDYAKLRTTINKDFKNDWNAKRIFETLQKINPHFYPEPSKQVVKFDKNGKQFVELQKVTTGYLTKDEAIEVYNECSEVLHAWNPYSSERDIKGLFEKYSDWASKLVILLSHHTIILTHRKTLVAAEMQSKISGNPKVFVFGQMNEPQIKNLDKETFLEYQKFNDTDNNT